MWWHRDVISNSIVFQDGEEEHSKYFENESLVSIYKYLAECWSECVRKEITIPIKHIITFDECGDFESRETTVIGKECEREENEIEVRLLEYDNTDVTETSSPVPCNTVTNTPSRIVIFKSTLANNISKVLGNSTMLQNFDFHHLEYKKKSHNSSRLTCAGMLP